MWKVEYTKRFLKELSEFPKEIQAQAESIVFGELLSGNPFSLGYVERMAGYRDK
jgi:mRNA-degrading endonuclease RelE of RelBE toxin-antitoxin system